MTLVVRRSGIQHKTCYKGGSVSREHWTQYRLKSNSRCETSNEKEGPAEMKFVSFWRALIPKKWLVDNLSSYFLHLAAAIIAEPVSHMFNHSLQTSAIPEAWNTTFVFPLLKCGDSAVLNTFQPISKHCILFKVLEWSVIDQLKDHPVYQTYYLVISLVLQKNAAL